MVDENGIMKRPSLSDDFVRRRAAESALEDIKQWGARDATDAQIMKDLSRCLTAAGGYECAKALEGIGWCVDAELVAILDHDYLSIARKEMVEKWVICLRVELPLSIGAEVLYRGRPARIAKLFESTAEYGVRTPDLKENQWITCIAEEVKPAVLEEAVA